MHVLLIEDDIEAAGLLMRGLGESGDTVEPAADGRERKYPGDENGWPIRLEPTTLPFAVIRLPLACFGKIT